MYIEEIAVRLIAATVQADGGVIGSESRRKLIIAESFAWAEEILSFQKWRLRNMGIDIPELDLKSHE